MSNAKITADITQKRTITAEMVARGGGGGTCDYNDLSNKPQINGTTLSGNKSLSELKIANEVHTHKKADITDFPTLATVATTNSYQDLDGKLQAGAGIIIEDNVISATGGGGSTSDIAWLPNVSTDGDISWQRSETLTPPATVNIKGGKGDAGERGEKGDKGDKGDTGDKGENGKSAYETAVDNGFVGTEIEWLASLKGADGENGADGKDGINGADGEKGSDGKSAYQSAVDGGYTGTELEFNSDLAKTESLITDGDGTKYLADDGTYKAVSGGGGSTADIADIKLTARAIAPAGWIICDGRTVSRTAYPELFAAISVMYGVGDGSTTFNVPNLCGRVPVGLDTTQTEFATIGKTGGAKTHTLTVAEMPKHSHTVAAVRLDNYLGGGSSGGVVANNNTTSVTGDNAAHNNLQPYLALNYIIYAGGN